MAWLPASRRPRLPRVPLQVGSNPHNKLYLATKAGKLGHMLGSLHQGEIEQP